MKLATCCLIILIGAVPSARPMPAPPTAASPKRLEVVEAREIRLEKSVMFWREGRQESTTTAVLLRLKVGDLSPFLPRGAAAPLFVYGSAVCEVLQLPVTTPEVVLLAPPLSAGEPSVLWLAMVPAPKYVNREVIERHRPKGPKLERGLLVRPRAELSGRVYEDVEELKRELRKEALIKK